MIDKRTTEKHQQQQQPRSPSQSLKSSSTPNTKSTASSSSSSTTKATLYSLESLFTIIICIFLLSAALNIHFVHQQELQQQKLLLINHHHHTHSNSNGFNFAGANTHYFNSKIHQLSVFTNHHKDYKDRIRKQLIDLKRQQSKSKSKSEPELQVHAQAQTKAKAQDKSSIQQQRVLHNDVLKTIDENHLRPYGAEAVWEDLLLHGEEIMKKNNNNNNNNQQQQHLVVVEVGAQNENQSLLAAKMKYHVHCVEPSPKSFQSIYGAMKKKLRRNVNKDYDSDTKKFIHLYNVAAGRESNQMLDFYTTGGTGDHVNQIDMWNMKRGPVPDDWPEEKRGKMVKVPSVQLDDIIYENRVKPNVLEGLGNDDGSPPPPIDKVYALKIDTQGYEPSVMGGLTKSIQSHKIQYIMTEYWPKGIGLMADRLDDPCSVAVPMLNTLSDAGYKLFALPSQGHPSAWEFSHTIFHHVSSWKNRPLDDFMADCKHYLNFEKEFPNPAYHMGYWTDVLAVAPGAEPFVPKKKPKKPPVTTSN